MGVKRRTLFLLILAFILVVGCNQAPITIPMPTAATVKPTVAPGNTPAPTATPEPTESPWPTATAMAVATATPEPILEDLRTIRRHRAIAAPTSTPKPTQTVCLKAPTPPQAGPASAKPVQVVFTKEGDVWRWDEGGEAVRLTWFGDVRKLTISHDGLVIAFVRGLDESALARGLEEYRTPELWAVNSDGSNVRQLLSADDLRAIAGDDPQALRLTFLGLKWVPGQHILAFDLFSLYDGQSRNAIWLVNADTGKWRVLLPPGKAGRFVYSPDGSQIALITERAISLVNADGTNRRTDLVTYPAVGLGHYAYRPSVWWAADSRSLRTVVPVTRNFEDVMAFAIWDIRADGKLPTQLGYVEASGFSVSLSPDLAYIAFWRPDAPRSNRRNLYLAHANGTGEVIYHTAYLLEFLGWVPDSEHFVFWEPGEWMPQLGHLCGGFVALTDMPTASVRWIDASRFLFVSSPRASRLRPPDKQGPWELRLGPVGGPSILIARIEDRLPAYDF